MKYLSKIILLFVVASSLILACTKESAFPSYGTGNVPTLTSSKSIVAAVAADSSTAVLDFSWTNPMYTNSDANTNKYVLEIDSAGRGFAKAVKYTLTGIRTKSFTGKQLNDILLNFGFTFNVAYGIDVRVTSSYANNNDIKVSNIIKIVATPYKVPPKITLHASGKLFIVGGATQGGWGSNPVPTPTQEFARVDETTFMGVFDLKANDQFLLLPVNGSWSEKYAVENNNVAGIQDGGDFKFYTSGGDNFKGPSSAGLYLITVDFQLGKFTIVPFAGPQLPTDLFMVGDATPGSWDNPAIGSLGGSTNLPPQQLTRLNSCVWEMPSIAITGGKEYLVLPVAGSWSNKYAVANKNLAGLAAGGNFGYNLGDNFPGPAVSGNYNIQLNFATAKFSTTKL